VTLGSFVTVRGDEAGQSKLDKAEKLGTKLLTEDDFLQLIVEKSASSGGAMKLKEKENKTPSPEIKKEPQEDKKEAKKEVKKEPQDIKKEVKKEPQDIKKEVKKETSSTWGALKPKTPLEEAIGFQIPKIPVPSAESKVSLFFYFFA
jgi:hypothetical protein